jgi:GNAT superfamily N-acetyltransferase
MKTEPPQIAVREARPEDQPFVLETAVRLSDVPLPPWRTPQEVAAGEVRCLRLFLEGGDAGSKLLVAEDAQGNLLGFIFLETQEAGSVLMAAAEAWAREQGFTKLTLNVFENNHHARKVYEHIGYSPETLRYVKLL